MSDGKTPSNYKAIRAAEKWKAKKFEYQEKYKSTLCKVYFGALLVTCGMAVYTYITIKNIGEDKTINIVSWPLYLVLAMHATNIIQQVCTLTGLENFFCSGLCNLLFDLYEIGVLIFMQSVLFSSTEWMQ